MRGGRGGGRDGGRRGWEAPAPGCSSRTGTRRVSINERAARVPGCQGTWACKDKVSCRWPRLCSQGAGMQAETRGLKQNRVTNNRADPACALRPERAGTDGASPGSARGVTRSVDRSRSHQWRVQSPGWRERRARGLIALGSSWRLAPRPHALCVPTCCSLALPCPSGSFLNF